MDTISLIKALAPAFAAGFAVQRLLEILDPLVERVTGSERKKVFLGLTSLVVGLGFAPGSASECWYTWAQTHRRTRLTGVICLICLSPA